MSWKFHWLRGEMSKMYQKMKRLEQDENEQMKEEADDLKRKYVNWSEVYENFNVKHEIVGNYMIVQIKGIPYTDVFKILFNYILANQYRNAQMRIERMAQVGMADKKVLTIKTLETRKVISNINFKSSKISSRKSREKGLLLRMFGD